MKKQTAMVLSFSALLAIGAMAPHVLWQADKSNRAPASIEQRDIFADQTNKFLIEKTTPKKDHMDKLLDDLAEDTQQKEAIKKREEEQAKVQPLKEIKKVENTSDRAVVQVVVLEEKKEEKKLDIQAQVSCLKEKQPADLEAQIKKLMEDKEAVMKELAELKKAKKEELKIDEKKDKKEKKVAASDNTEDVLGIMSQLTNLMISQQQQQMLMMNQMFSMFQQQPKQQSYYQGFSPLSDYMSPYAFNASSFTFPSYESPYSLSGFNNKIGINSNFGGVYSSFDRTPAATTQDFSGLTLERSPIGNSESFQPQALEKRPHNGFDFTRTQF